MSKIVALLVAFIPLLGCAKDSSTPDLNGVWKTVFVSTDDPSWKIIDIACRGQCPSSQYQFLSDLLSDPANDDKPLTELLEESRVYYADVYLSEHMTPDARRKLETHDPDKGAGAIDCSPEGDDLHHQITAPLPMQITQKSDRVLIEYEYWNQVRTIFTDGRSRPEFSSRTRLGHSIGRYEDSDLVVETVNMLPMELFTPAGFIAVSNETVLIERYSIGDDGQRLEFEWTVVDPVTFHGPFSGKVPFLRAVDWELSKWECEAITGEF